MCGKGQFDIGDEVSQTFDLGVLHVHAHAILEHRPDLRVEITKYRVGVTQSLKMHQADEYVVRFSCPVTLIWYTWSMYSAFVVHEISER